MEIISLFVSIMILLAGARLAGELFRRVRQPALVGELLAGIILGPTIFGIVVPSPNLDLLSTIAIFFLMLLIGLEMDLREIKRTGKSAIVISVVSLTIPFLAGYFITTSFGFEQNQSLFIGLLLSVTSVPVSAIILMEFGLLKTKIGTTVLSAAVIDDIISLVILAVILSLHNSGNAGIDYTEIGLSIGKIIIFLVGIIGLAFLVYNLNRWFPNRFESFFVKAKTREAIFGILIIISIAISLLAQLAGMNFIIGTFFAGLIFSKQILGKKETDRAYGIVSGMTFGFFAPLFFAIIGIKFSGQSITSVLPLLVFLVIAGLATKTFGGYVGARIFKHPKKESLAIASLLNGRGTVGLAITSLAYSIGLLDIVLFSVAITIWFVTTMLTPIIARPFLNKLDIKEYDSTN